MKIFRSNLFLWCLGIALAVQVYIAFETPVGGSFSDAATFAMNGVQAETPVKATFIRDLTPGQLGSLAEFRDLYGDSGQVFMTDTHDLSEMKPGNVLVMRLAYDRSTKHFNLVEIIRVNPIMVFPLIPGLGELGRNMLFHVPMSMVAFIAFIMGTVYSILYLKKKDFEYDRHARAASAAGLLFTILATVTGSIWARFSWGSFWSWDPREVSIFILLLIYIAYFMLRSLLEESEDKKARIAAVYNIIGVISAFFLMFILPRITESLHPGGGSLVGKGAEAPLLNASGHVYVDRTLLNMHWVSVVLFLLVFLWIKDMYTRVLRMEAKRAESE